jgi:hypothetical protein
MAYAAMPKFPQFKVRASFAVARCLPASPTPHATPSPPLRDPPPLPQCHKLLGKGSYGKVYKVERESDKQLYALKEADLGSMSQAERADAVNEVRLLVSINHHNVVSSCLRCSWPWSALARPLTAPNHQRAGCPQEPGHCFSAVHAPHWLGPFLPTHGIGHPSTPWRLS